MLARLDARSSIVWSTAKIHFMRCAAAESHMRAKLVVPVCKTNKLTTERVAAQRNQYSASELSFNRENQPFDHGDATVLADGAVTGWLDAFTLHPAPKRTAVEDALSVADNVLGRGSGVTHGLAQHGADGAAVWPVGEEPD